MTREAREMQERLQRALERLRRSAVDHGVGGQSVQLTLDHEAANAAEAR
jgi:DNA-binding protein YbaB